MRTDQSGNAFSGDWVGGASGKTGSDLTHAKTQRHEGREGIVIKAADTIAPSPHFHGVGRAIAFFW